MKAFFLAISLVLTSSMASATKVIGNGGDSYAFEFVEVAYSIMHNISWEVVEGFTFDDLQRVIRDTKVESTNVDLFLDGVPKDAINYPAEKKIIFNYRRWREMDISLRPVFVLHEYLGILGIDDSSYRYSTLYLKSFTNRKRVMELYGPMTVNPGTSQEYTINAIVSVENYTYNIVPFDDPATMSLRVKVRHRDDERLYLLPMKGILVSVSYGTGKDESYLLLRVLEKVSEGEEWKSAAYAIRSYLVRFEGSLPQRVPESLNLIGPIVELDE